MLSVVGFCLTITGFAAVAMVCLFLVLRHFSAKDDNRLKEKESIYQPRFVEICRLIKALKDHKRLPAGERIGDHIKRLFELIQFFIKEKMINPEPREMLPGSEKIAGIILCEKSNWMLVATAGGILEVNDHLLVYISLDESVRKMLQKKATEQVITRVVAANLPEKIWKNLNI